jgi:hypothetical protein
MSDGQIRTTEQPTIALALVAARMKKILVVVAAALAFGSPSLGQEPASLAAEKNVYLEKSEKEAHVAKIPWPAQDLWQMSGPANAIETVLTQAKTAFLQTDLPEAFSAPAWLSKYYTLVIDPKDADFYIFVRAGAGGSSNPDVLVMQANGLRVALAATELPRPEAPNEEPRIDPYNLCYEWPTSQSATCALLNFSEYLATTNPAVPKSPALTNWEQLQCLIQDAAVKKGSRDARFQ